jgi:glutamate dehydrogenase
MEIAIDPEKEPITVTGIGDMSGDVFGNGMLLSRKIKLVAAFNHMHIFIDPSPDTAVSFKERQRLFNKPRSSWEDYNSKLISKGGGVYERSAKYIKLSLASKKVLDIGDDSLTPDELIRAILKAPVDLLWNGGIGTYVKHSKESDEDVGDRINNSVRVDGKELRCKVVGEGGNLGLTQLGRIEYARNGGIINNDAIDNSAGVDCSDHEVNIKIALVQALSNGQISPRKRNNLLEKMTDEVSSLVLRDNHQQNRALTIAFHQETSLFEQQVRLIKKMEKSGLLDRQIEFLPDDEQLDEMRKNNTQFTRPELCVILLYSKLSLYEHIINSTLPDDPYFEGELLRYFPKTMTKDYGQVIRQHSLRREIIATIVTNSIINRGGITFWQGMADDTGMSPQEVARAYVISRDAFGLRKIWDDIESLNGKIESRVQTEMFIEIKDFIKRSSHWFLRNSKIPLQVAEIIDTYKDGISQMSGSYEEIISPSIKKSMNKIINNYTSRGVPDTIAKDIAKLETMSSACDIAKIVMETNAKARDVGELYFAIGAEIGLGWLRIKASHINIESHWDRLARNTIVSDLYDHQRALTKNAIKADITTIDNWKEKNKVAMNRYLSFLSDIKSSPSIDLPMLMVGLRHIKSI